MSDRAECRDCGQQIRVYGRFGWMHVQGYGQPGERMGELHCKGRGTLAVAEPRPGTRRSGAVR